MHFAEQHCLGCPSALCDCAEEYPLHNNNNNNNALQGTLLECQPFSLVVTTNLCHSHTKHASSSRSHDKTL